MAVPATTDGFPCARPASELRPRSVEWLWQLRLGLGKLAIFEGDPGLGKSLVALDLCARLSTGQPFPDGTPSPEVGNSIFLSAEDGQEDTIRARFQALGADMARVFVLPPVHDRTGEPLGFPGHIDVLDRELTRTGVRLVVIDPIVAFLDQSVFEGSDRSVRRALLGLAQLAEKHGCVILLIRHLNKHEGSRSLYRGGGSIGFLAACRAAWLVARDPLRPDRCVLAQVKNNLAAAQPSLAYVVIRQEPAPPKLQWEGPTAWTADQLLSAGPRTAHVTPRDRATDFLTAFLADGPRTSREVWAAAEEQGLAERTIGRAKQELEIRSLRRFVDNKLQSYWLLPGQSLPDTAAPPADPETDLEPWLKPVRDMYPPATPLDEM
jgi:putative DNA primase/helicase